MLFDLSHPLTHGMPVYPGDPRTRFSAAVTHDESGFSVHDIALSSHAGTHVDAPRHVRPDGGGVHEEAVLDACIGKALVIDCSTAKGEEITPADLGNSRDLIVPGSRILLATGWSERFGEPGYFDGFPSISVELARELAERGIRLLGVETPSVHTSDSHLVHDILLSGGIIIVENLANLTRLAGKNVLFAAAPLPLAGMDGSPVRAWAMV